MASRVATRPRPEEHNRTPARRASPPGYRVLRERYSVLEKLGTGCTATVVRAIDRTTKQEVAVKIVPKRLLTGRECRTALAREVSVLSKLNHPNIVQFCHAFEDTDHVYIATEYCPNGDMHEYIRTRSQGLDEREALKYMRQVLHAVWYLHSERIAHRDLKLENVVFVGGKVKLIDFGLCYWRRPGGDRYTRQHCGTPQYAAPEIMSKSAYVPEQGDMWACGVMLFAMLTRSLPFSGRTWSDLEKNIAAANTDTLMDTPLLNHSSPGTRHLLRRLLSVTPTRRPTPKQAVELLDTAILNCTFRRN